jgi:aminoglycoside phosphotransferase family enzyme/predicted kinase
MTDRNAPDTDLLESVFAFLTTHPGVHRIDTHAASVFLDGTRALKIKRAVRFPFLDYSTLAKRKAACEEEIRINRPYAPQIYHRVVAITRDNDGRLSIDGNGTPIEFAVEMTRFDERQTIDHLAAAGLLDPGLVDGIADAIAGSHRIAPHAQTSPWIESVERIIEDDCAALGAAGRFAAGGIDELRQASREAFSRVRGLLEQRGAEGHVRRCHGDLHLANIVLIEQVPVLFDAIEFDERLASIDVLYDLAFPLMDLLHHGQHVAANQLLNRYLATTPAENLDALAALPLFMSMRAAIRAIVLAAKLDRAGTGTTGIMDAARAYVDLATALIRPPAPKMIAVGGLSGTGKSVLAHALAPFVEPQPGAVLLRSDALRKRLFQVNETERLSASAYRPEVTERIYDGLERDAQRIVSQGHSVVVDAVFAQEIERIAIRERAQRANVRFVGLFLTTDLATRQARIGRRKADASDATPELAALQEKYELGAIDWEIIDASGRPETVLEQVRARVAQLISR